MKKIFMMAVLLTGATQIMSNVGPVVFTSVNGDEYSDCYVNWNWYKKPASGTLTCTKTPKKPMHKAGRAEDADKKSKKIIPHVSGHYPEHTRKKQVATPMKKSWRINERGFDKNYFAENIKKWADKGYSVTSVQIDSSSQIKTFIKNAGMYPVKSKMKKSH